MLCDLAGWAGMFPTAFAIGRVSFEEELLSTDLEGRCCKKGRPNEWFWTCLITRGGGALLENCLLKAVGIMASCA